jgi:hypothetical protein
LAVAGIINLLPVSGALGPQWLKSLYGLEIANPDLDVLLRHRALLFGIVGVLLLASILRPSLRAVAVIVGATSMASFIGVALVVGGYSAAISKIVIADIVGLLALVPAAFGIMSSSQRSE